MATNEELAKKIKELSDWASNKANFSNQNHLDALKRELKKLSNDAAALSSGVSVTSDRVQDEIDFGDFLSDIGDSIVETQQKLDGKSKNYLQDIKGQPHIQPSVFRIPRVSAEIKFGMRKSKGKGFNIIIAKSKNEEETSLNQSMQFEILSVPPPPDFQQSFYEMIPALGFVFSAAERSLIFRDIARCEPRQKDMKLLEDDPNRVLILEVHPKAEDKMDDYLLLYAQNNNDKDVGIWHFTRDNNPDLSKAKKPEFTTVLKFTLAARDGENYEILRDFVNKFSDLQQNLL
ncbi:MAG: hypothetical protein AAF502_11195 [Bacteroidota bacterium]